MATEHDEWLKSTLGFDPGAPVGPALQAAGPDKQSQEFHEKFQAGLAPIDADLGYIGENAEEAKHAPLVSRRDGLVTAYQAAAAKIDPADEAKAKTAIGQALGELSGVAGQVAAARKAAEKAFTDWQARGEKAAEMADQVQEMTSWGHPKAPPLGAPLEALHGQVAAKKYAEASTGFDKLQHQVQPVHDDYVKQKAAQAEYEPAETAIEPRLAQSEACAFKTLEKTHAVLAPGKAAMAKAADAKDFVHALEKQKDLATKLDAYEQALAALEAKKKAYDDAVAQLQPKLDQAKQVDHPKLKPLQQELETLHPPMEKKAQAEDFDGALAAAEQLDGKADQFDQAVKELEQQKKDYEDAMAALQPRLDTAAKCEFKSLAPMQTALTACLPPMQKLATAEDYAGAKTDADDLALRLTDFEKTVADIEAKKKAFEDARQALDPKLQAMAQASPHKALEADKKAIDDAVPIMEKAAGDEQYDAALQSATDLGAKADKYIADAQAIDDKKKQFDDAWAKLQPRLDDMKQTRNDDLAPMQQEVLRCADDTKKMADDEDYDAALKSADTLTREFDEYDKADANKIYSVEWKNKKYYGNGAQLAAIKLKLVQDGIKQVLPPLKAKAESCEGRVADMKKLNNEQYVVAFFVQAIGGADLGTVEAAISNHQSALATLQSAAADAATAQSNYEKAVEAVTATERAMADYMEKLDTGGKYTVYGLQAVEVVAFGIAACCATPLLLGEGAGILASMAAGGIANMGFGALDEAANQYAPAIVDGKDVDWDKAKIAIGKAALINGVGGMLGGGFGGRLKADVGKGIIQKLAIDDPVVKERVLGALENAMGGLVQGALAKRQDLAEGKMTTGEFVAYLIESAIAGGLGGAITPGMKKI